MDGVKTLATLVLGGAFDATELTDNDIVIDTKLVDELQQRLVTGFDDVHIELVSRNDFDAALAREAALREELSGTIEKLIQYEQGFWGRMASKNRKEADDLMQRLTAAEQRNAVMSKLLQRCIPVCRYKGSHTERALINEIETALAKPTESGASE